MINTTCYMYRIITTVCYLLRHDRAYYRHVLLFIFLFIKLNKMNNHAAIGLVCCCNQSIFLNIIAPNNV